MWARNNSNSLEIVHTDPTGKWADGLPFFEVPAELEKFIDSSFTYNEESSKFEPASLDDIKNKVMNNVAELRYQREVAGVSVDGTFIKTDRESQSQLASIYASMKSGLISSTSWKSGTGVFTTITLAELEVIAKAVVDHVSDCFTKEQVECEKVKVLTTLEEVIAFVAESFKVELPAIETPVVE